MNKSPKKLSCHFHEVLNKLSHSQKRDCSKYRNNRLNNQMTSLKLRNSYSFVYEKPVEGSPFWGEPSRIGFYGEYPCIKYTIKKHAILIDIPLHGNPCIFASVFFNTDKKNGKKNGKQKTNFLRTCLADCLCKISHMQ